MFCKLITAADAAKTGSTEWCGLPAWPAFPLITAWKNPHPASKGPGLEPITDVGCWCDTWTANIASISSSAPSSIIRLAPIPASSAGWKSNTAVPCHNECQKPWTGNTRERGIITSKPHLYVNSMQLLLILLFVIKSHWMCFNFLHKDPIFRIKDKLETAVSSSQMILNWKECKPDVWLSTEKNVA